MLQVKHLTITHKQDLTTLVENLSFVLNPGDRAAIIGEEGNGKSTVLKLLYDPGLIAPYAEWSGEILDRELRKGYLAQELTADQLSLSVYEFCQSDPAFADADPRQLDRAARQVGLDARLFYGWRLISTLSGGERGRVLLTKLVLKEDNFLILDEPTNHLDMDSREMLETALLGFEGTILTVSHDRYFINRLADRVIVMDNGCVAMDGTPKEVFARVDELRSMGLTVPDTVDLLDRLRHEGVDVPLDALTVEDCAEAIAAAWK